MSYEFKIGLRPENIRKNWQSILIDGSGFYLLLEHVSLEVGTLAIQVSSDGSSLHYSNYLLGGTSFRKLLVKIFGLCIGPNISISFLKGGGIGAKNTTKYILNDVLGIYSYNLPWFGYDGILRRCSLDVIMMAWPMKRICTLPTTLLFHRIGPDLWLVKSTGIIYGIFRLILYPWTIRSNWI